MAFKAWELPTQNRGGKMGENMVSICYHEGKNVSLTFNQFVSKTIQRKGFKKISIYQDDITSEINLVIGNVGLSLSRTGKEDESFNYKLGSKVWVKRLCEELGISLDGKRYILYITPNLSKTNDCLSYRILKVQYV